MLEVLTFFLLTTLYKVLNHFRQKHDGIHRFMVSMGETYYRVIIITWIGSYQSLKKYNKCLLSMATETLVIWSPSGLIHGPMRAMSVSFDMLSSLQCPEMFSILF